ncbi:MAG: ferritin-like domain-containing protein [Chloroflexi bacterium]|jgi:ferritin-like metal-binding protein YciE|nr:ferritin-like domain-containing protein [Chloroflexota bacterium]
MALKSLDDLLLHELKDIYDAEHQITEALPKMRQAASSNELKKAFEEHLKVTEEQIKRLEQVFEQLGEKPKREACKGMKGLVAEGQNVMEEGDKGDTLDAALIASAQKVEHYEIASYGSVRTYANMLGHRDVAQLLQQTLDEESMTDEKLTGIAERLNRQAK